MQTARVAPIITRYFTHKRLKIFYTQFFQIGYFKVGYFLERENLKVFVDLSDNIT